MAIDFKPKNNIQFTAQQNNNTIEKPKGFLRELGEAIVRPAAEVGVGLYNIGSIAQGKGSPVRNLPFLGETKPFMTGEETFGQGVSKMAGYGLDIGSNLVGGFGVKQIAKAGWKGALMKGLSSGVKTGATTGAMVGAGKSLEDNKDALNVLGNTLGGAILGGATGGALGGATATAGKVIRGVLQPGKTISDIGKGIKGAGESIQQRVIKPTQKDIKAGFKIENVSKYDVGGNLGDSFVKVKDQIKSNMDELNNIVSTIAPKKRYKFDLENYVNELEDKYRKGGVQLLGQGKKVLNEVENLKGELDLAFGNNWRDNLSGFEDVLDIKRRAGLNAAFMHDATKSQPTPEEKVWTDFYMLLKDKLEKEAPPEFQAVNKRLSELIPIEQALIRRIPISERQNVLNIGDIVSLTAGAIDPRALTIGVLNRVLRSGTVANKLMQAGSKIEGAGAKLAPTDELIKSIPQNQQGFARLPFGTNNLESSSILKSWVNKNFGEDIDKVSIIDKKAFISAFEQDILDKKYTLNNLRSEVKINPKDLDEAIEKGKIEYGKGLETKIILPDGGFYSVRDKKINDYIRIYKELKEIEGFSSPVVGKTAGSVIKSSDDALLQEAKNVKLNREFAKDLSPEDRKIEKLAFNKIDTSGDKILSDYTKKYGNVVNADNFRQYFKDVGYRGSNSAAVQEPSSEISKKAFTLGLKRDGIFAPLFAGGSGTGKTSAISGLPELNEILKNSSVILDGNLSSYNSALKKIVEAKEAGKKVPLIYVYRDPVDSLVMGVIKRMINNPDEMGRVVPTKVIANNHINSWEVIKRLTREGKKDIYFIDNSLGAGKAKLSSLNELSNKISYPSEEKLTEMFNKKVKELYDNRTKIGSRAITKDEYVSLIK